MNTNKERILIQKYVEQIKMNDRIKKTMVQDEQYFTWLASFTKAHDGKFSDDQWIYHPDQISAEDKKKVEQLYLFYEALSEHSIKHNISQESSTNFHGFSLLVRFHNDNYKIGYLSGQGSFFYCEEINDRIDTNNVIDFNNVLNENKQDRIY